MADFQSFLFKSMHSIGLQDDSGSLADNQEGDTHKKSTSTISSNKTKSSNSKTNDLNKSISTTSSNSIEKDFPKPVSGNRNLKKTSFYNKNNDSFCNISILTAETFVSNTTMSKELGESNSNFALKEKGKEATSTVAFENEELPPPPTPFQTDQKEDEEIKETDKIPEQLKTETETHNEEKYDNNQNEIIPETNKEDNDSEKEYELKGPKPVKPLNTINEELVNKKTEESQLSMRQRDSSHDGERETKSPKPVFGSISRRILKKLSTGDFSPIRSIFQKKNSICKQSSNNLSKQQPQSNEPSVNNEDGFELKKEDKESALMDPVLNNFEAEILRKTKTEILNDYNNKAKQPKQLEFENNLKQSKELFDEKKKNLASPSQTVLEELKRLSEHNIPWDELESYSAISLLNRVRLNSDKQYNSLPIIYNTVGERIDSLQIRKWLKTLEDASKNVIKEPEKNEKPNETTQNQVKSFFKKPKKTEKKSPEKPVELEKVIYKNEPEKRRKNKIKPCEPEDEDDENESKFYINRSTKPNFELKTRKPRTPSPDVDTIEFSISESEFEQEVEEKEVEADETIIVKSKEKNMNIDQIDHLYNEINENEMKTRKHRRNNYKNDENFDEGSKPRVNGRTNIRKAATLNGFPNEPNHDEYEPTHATTMKAKSHPMFDTKKHNSAAEAAKNFLKKPINSLAKLKSPERKILYNEWMTIIKKIDSDPKFDLETLVRTRGRFTEHDAISYRDQLKSARSVPNFSDLQLSLLNNSNSNDDVRNHGKDYSKKISTLPNRSLYQNEQKKSVGIPNDTLPAYNEEKPVLHPIKPKIKLTLKKSEIETIRDEIKKKHKNISTHELNKLVLQTLRSKALTAMKEKQEQRKRIDEDDEEPEAEELVEKVNQKIEVATVKQHNKKHRTHHEHEKVEKEDDKIRTRNRKENRETSEESTITEKPPRRRKKHHDHSEVSTTIQEEDETTEETSIMSKYKNFAQKCRNDGAKAFCDEFGKLRNKIFKNQTKKDTVEETIHRSKTHHEHDERRQRRHDESSHNRIRDESSNRKRSSSNAAKQTTSKATHKQFTSMSPPRPPPPKRPPPPRPSATTRDTSHNRSHSRQRRNDNSNDVPRRVPKSEITKIPRSSKPPNIPPPPPRSANRDEETFHNSSRTYELDEYEYTGRHRRRDESHTRTKHQNDRRKISQSPIVPSHTRQHRSHSRHQIAKERNRSPSLLDIQKQQQQQRTRHRDRA